MTETSINPISSVRPPESGAASRALAPVVRAGTTPAAGQMPVEADKSAKPVETPPDQSGSFSNVSIHFKLDDKTNDLTVIVVDQKSKRVLRTIPASELHKLQAGDLLKLTA